jgi:uncharacterized protein
LRRLRRAGRGDGRGRVALVADSGALYALYDSRDRNHRAVRKAVEEEGGAIIVPVVILGELDYLLRTRIGVVAEVRLLEGVLNGALVLESFTENDAARCRELLLKYEDLDLGLVDASVIATADRLNIRRILTVDERDFRAVRSSRGEAFVLVPGDERARRKGRD